MTDGTDHDAAGEDALAGTRVLVAEDRGLIAAKVAQILHRAGCAVVGPVGTLAAALGAVQREHEALHAAVVDIDLHGEHAFPLTEALRGCGVPFLFLTGYGPLMVPEAWRGTIRVEKPFDAAGLLSALAATLAGEAAPARNPGRTPAPPSRVIRRSWETIRRSRDLLVESDILHERWRRTGKA